MTAFGIFLYSASAYAVIAIAEIAVKALRARRNFQEPASELLQLVTEERMRQASSVLSAAMDAMQENLPLDVTRSQIVLYYNDGCKLVLDCEQERMKAQL